MSMRTSLPAALLFVAITATACSSAGSPARSGDGSAGPTTEPSAVVGAISHPTGADEIILRFDEAGGLMMQEWFAAHAPYFTLFGDGTVVFTSNVGTAPPVEGGVMVNAPYRTARLTEDQIQTFLEYALAEGGLAAARAEYQNPLIADAPTAVFEINADGIEKTVSVVALGLEDMEPNADTAIKEALAELGTRLRDFDAGGTLGSAPYEPAAYRATLTPAEGLQGVAFTDWPWTDLTPADFALPEDPTVLQQGRAVITAEQAAAVGIDGFEGGIPGGVYIRDGEGRAYTFALRPLLPNETE
jgi:hypothetical protein